MKRKRVVSRERKVGGLVHLILHVSPADGVEVAGG